jgi:phage tail-like protein
MRNPDEDPIGVAQFGVEVDHLNLGTFTSCEGLQAEYAFEEVNEGGNNQYIHRLPGRLKYQNVKLTRPLSAQSMKVPVWFASFEQGRKKRGQATITLRSGHSIVVCRWVLKEVHPVRWSGPTFSADTNGIGKETLEIAYHGFDWTK